MKLRGPLSAKLALCGARRFFLFPSLRQQERERERERARARTKKQFAQRKHLHPEKNVEYSGYLFIAGGSDLGGFQFLKAPGPSTTCSF